MELEKAIIFNQETHQFFPVLFNPEQYTVNRDVNFAQIAVPGASAPLLQFVHGNMQTLEIELLVDTYEAHDYWGSRTRAGEDVRHLTDKIVNLMNINPETHAPPRLSFIWGDLDFECVLARVNQRFIMFRSDGVPVRARLQVTFNQYHNVEMEAKAIKRETSDYTRTYAVHQGETLTTIAARTYGNPTLWRAIAQLNDVADPRSLQVGARLRIPQLPYRDPETGEVIQ